MISRCSSPMPAMMSWPVSSLVKQRKVGSSSARRCRPSPIFSRSALVLGSTAIEMTGSGKVGGSSRTSKSSSQSVSPVVMFLKPDQRGDVAGESGLHVDALVGLDHHDAADALALARARIVDHVALAQLAAIDAEEHQLADVGVGPELEGQGTELAVVVGGDFDLVSRCPATMPTAGGTSSGEGR